ncbi:MAG: GNAT family N-acetyltransferase [Flaviflexus sp.]|nr:GNAT family N-acetyltransferase [Flaviflexus sp.]
MRVSIRPATAVDAGALARLEAELHGRDPRDWEDLATELRDASDSSTWLALGDGSPVGYLVTRALGPGQPRALEVAALLVLPDHRRSGVGTALLNFAIGDAPAQAPRRPADPAGGAGVDVGGEAEDFFASAGFAPAGDLFIR